MQTTRRLFYASMITAVATFILLLVGGLVNPTGSSLACPDWPLCYGSLFPDMVGGVRFEHTHRLFATCVGLMTLAVCWVAFQNRHQDRKAFVLGSGLVILVIFQGVLGGMTVIFKLPLLVSTAHLAVSLLFYLGLLTLAVRSFTPTPISQPLPGSPRCRLPLLSWALAMMVVQIILGALVRHTESGRACGADAFLCQGQLWPTWPQGQIHMIHRIGAGVAALLAIYATMVTYRHLNNTPYRGLVKTLTLAIPILVVLQVILGMLSVATFIALIPVTAHLGVGVLLLSCLFLLWLLF